MGKIFLLVGEIFNRDTLATNRVNDGKRANSSEAPGSEKFKHLFLGASWISMVVDFIEHDDSLSPSSGLLGTKTSLRIGPSCASTTSNTDRLSAKRAQPRYRSPHVGCIDDNLGAFVLTAFLA